MSEPRHRKLVALSTAALVSTCQPQILERIPTEIFNLWLDVFGEIKESQREVPEDEDGCGFQKLPMNRSDTLTVPPSTLLGVIGN